MTTIVAESRPFTDATIALLRTTGRQIGDGVAPDGAANPPPKFFPYATVYTGTVTLLGSLDAPREDGIHRAHVNCVGRDRKGAERMRDQVRALLLDRTAWTIPGYAVTSVSHVVSPDVTRDDDVTPAVFVAPVLVDVLVTPIIGS